MLTLLNFNPFKFKEPHVAGAQVLGGAVPEHRFYLEVEGRQAWAPRPEPTTYCCVTLGKAASLSLSTSPC